MSDSPASALDPLALSDAALLAQCEVDTYRASGPGGQKRNKTESAVRLRHLPSGLSATATDSRSQHENRARALRRLRWEIAARRRRELTLEDYAPPEALRALLPGGAGVGRKSAEYAIAISHLLDLFVAEQCAVSATAQRLGISSGALSKLLLAEPWVARAVGELRAARGLRALR
ncbi:MAG: hypothetical protein KC503_15010 [Myxococcales bacterium]|nr:hypothetical protein [Myxococcales bacterium]